MKETKCLFCGWVFMGDDDGYPFCDRCIEKLELLNVDINYAEKILTKKEVLK